ncbi:glycosyltransferase [Granulosicoccus antarcticus]|uniref:Glycosyltransferase subfamily 4-like N-terminal domain-containing protein n=1 Tax=Granulosicoccus antarcticus IMCC3135 TaxID=1192854 RepID=A0A2Z2NSW2_9GAMM|nr:glycosyltransferase [Granulosicoccus antarcticus]ASJ74612.1 hypothetical protein IMCC3135_22710 [Granulosicoccus antarcticus IMCC3135]
MNIWLTQRAESTPHDEGSSRRYMRTGQMAESLSRSGHNIIWWTGDYDHYGQNQRKFGDENIIVNDNYSIQYLDVTGYTKSFSLTRLRYDRNVGARFRRLAESYSDMPDLIIASMPSADLALESVKFGKERGIPVVIDVRDQHPDVFTWLVPKFARPFMPLLTLPMRLKVKGALRGCSAIWGITENFVDWGIEIACRQKTSFDVALPMAYRYRKFQEVEKMEATEYWANKSLLTPTSLNCIFIGTLSDSFNFETIFEAASLLESWGSDVKFVFCGTGTQSDYVVSECKRLESCDYTGWLNAKELQAGMERSDVGLAPYVQASNYVDNMPNKPVEYLCGGIIVATSLQGGKVKNIIIDNGGGIVYSDAKSLAVQLHQLSKDKTKLISMKEKAATIFVNNFDADTQERIMLKAIDNLLIKHKDMTSTK